MRILLISNSFPKPFNKTMGTYIYDQAIELKKINNELFVISPSMFIPRFMKLILKNTKFHNYTLLGDEYEIDNINVISPKTFQYGRILRKFPNVEYMFYRIKLLREIEEFIKDNNIELIYAVGTFIEGRLAYELYKNTGIPYVLTEHSNSNIINSIKHKGLYIKILKNAKRVFFVSKKSQELFLTIHEDTKNTDVIINGFRKEHINYKINKKDEILKIISVGFLEERKGWINLLKCINQIEKLKPGRISLEIVGDGPLKSSIEKYISDNNLRSVCKMTGIIPHKKVIESMSKSDLFCLVSKNEPLGIVYLEAMSVGTPIIGSKGEGISDIIINNENGFLVNYGDIEELKKLIIKILENKSLLEYISIKGQKTSLNYTWENNAIQWLRSVNKAIVKE